MVALFADAGRKKLTTLVLGSEQERVLRQAATTAIRRTVTQLAPSGGEQAEQIAMVVSEVFHNPVLDTALAGQATLLQALGAGIAANLAVLDDASLTGTGQSSAEALGVSGNAIAETLAGHLVREIMLGGSRGGLLAPLADQLNHDMTHLQGQRIEGVLAQLADRVTALVRPDSATAIQGKPVRLLPRPTYLAGREELLADLDTRLTGGDGLRPRIVSLHGLGGAGKTSVAVEYAHRHLGEVGVAWQFPAEDTAVLAAGFTHLATQLGIGGAAEGRDPVASVHSALAADPAGWLLIFANVPGPEQVRAFMPPAGHGRVVITSRNALWPQSQAVEVPVLDRDVATGFLIDRAGDPDEQAARALAGALGGLPLALEQAGAYTQASGGTLAGYLVLFQRRRGDLLARGGPAGYPGTVATTWALAFAQLEESAPAAAGLLRLLAYCAPEAIPLRLLLQPRPGLTDDLAQAVAEVLAPLMDDELVAGDAVAALQEYSLARPAGDRAVSVHRLVQAVTADQMPADLGEAWRHAAAVLIEAALPGDPGQPGAWPVFAALLPHAQAALAADSDGMTRIASYLAQSGNYTAARETWQEVLSARIQNLGREHPDTLLARSDVALWTGAAGDAAGARDQLAALVPVYERVLGPEHPHTLTARANLAVWIREEGHAAEARDQFAALLPIRARVLGPEHPETLSTRTNLAYVTGEAGDAAAARDQLAELVSACERVLGPEHPQTLSARFNLATWTGEAGDAAAARDQLAELVPTYERVLGPEHPETVKARAGVAAEAGRAGDAAGARDQLATLVSVYERVFGPEHPETLKARAGVAGWTAKAGNAEWARDQFAALLPIEERVLGPEHPETLTTRASLANWTLELGDMAGARDQLTALLPIQERVLGPEHRQTLNTRANLAVSTGRTGDPVGARDQLAALAPIEERVLGPEHPDTLATRARLADWSRAAAEGQRSGRIS